MTDFARRVRVAFRQHLPFRTRAHTRVAFILHRELELHDEDETVVVRVSHD